MKTSIIIPTFNESENIEILINKILKLGLAEISIIVIDDNSPDGTSKIVSKISEENKQVFLINRPQKMGLGTAHIEGFKKALKINSEIILTMDADFSHDPKYIPEIIKLSNNFDVTIGSRYVKNGGVSNWPTYRKLISKCANFLARNTLSLKTKDCTAGFRCYKRDVLQAVDFNEVSSNGYSFLIEILYLIQKRDYNIGEYPIIFTDRVNGKSKISKKEILNAFKTILKIKLHGRKYKKT